MALPCMHFSAASITSKRDESIIHGSRATSGSDAMRLRKCTISARVSIIASSMLMSRIMAPSRTCLRAMPRASSYDFSFISRRNLRLPATLHRSPTLMKAPSAVNSSRPESHPRGVAAVWRLAEGVATASAMARMWSGVEPQQPPTMSTRPSSTKRRMSRAIISGVWS